MCLPLCQSQYLEGRYCDWSLLGHMLTPLSARRSLIGQPTRTTEWGRSKQERHGLLEGQGEAECFWALGQAFLCPHDLAADRLPSFLQPRPSCTLCGSSLSTCRVLMAALPLTRPFAPSVLDAFSHLQGKCCHFLKSPVSPPAHFESFPLPFPQHL